MCPLPPPLSVHLSLSQHTLLCVSHVLSLSLCIHQEKSRPGHREKAQAQKGILTGNRPHQTLIWDSQPPEPREHTCLWFQPPVSGAWLWWDQAAEYTSVRVRTDQAACTLKISVFYCAYTIFSSKGWGLKMEELYF